MLAHVEPVNFHALRQLAVIVSPLRHGFESDAARQCTRRLAPRAPRWLLLVLVHGISEYLQMALQAESKRFFALPLEQKRESR